MTPWLLAANTSDLLRTAMLVGLPLIGSILLAYGVFNAAFDMRQVNRKKVMSRLQGGRSKRTERDDFNFQNFRKQTVEATGTMAKIFSKWQITTNLQRVLEQANVAWSAPQLLVNLTAISSCLLAVMLLLNLPLLASVGTAAAVFVFPILWLFRRRKKRMKKFTEQLPDVFALLSQALRAGHSLASGMQLIAKEMPDPAGVEFGRVFHEQNLGLKIEDALRNMSDRVGILDVRFFVTAVLIQRQVGGDLAEVLEKIGKVITERIQLFGTVQALTAEGRLSGYVLLALPVLVLGALLKVNPEYATMLFTDPLGKMMLTTAIIMQLMGWAMIKKIVNIKV